MLLACTHMYSYVIRMSLVCNRMLSVCHSYVIRMSLLCTCMSSVCHSYVIRMSLVRHPYVTRMTSVCHPYVTRMYSYVTRMWFYHEFLRILFFTPLKYAQLLKKTLKKRLVTTPIRCKNHTSVKRRHTQYKICDDMLVVRYSAGIVPEKKSNK